MIETRFIKVGLAVLWSDHTWTESEYLLIDTEEIDNAEYGLDNEMILAAAKEAYENRYGVTRLGLYVIMYVEEVTEDGDE